MKKHNYPHMISNGGILTALAVLFQSSPIFLPGIGLILSPFATLPIALASVSSSYQGIITFLSSAIILLFISPQESVIFLLTTGSLGFALGASYYNGFVRSIAIPAITLCIGINILTFGLGIAAFGDMTPNSSLLSAILIFLLFAISYALVWELILKFFIRILVKTKLMVTFQPRKRN